LRPRDGLEQVRMRPEGTRFVFMGRQYETALWGDHNLLNVLAAISAAEGLGVSPGAIEEGVAAAQAPPGRLEPVQNPLGLRVLVDYAHTDGSLEAVLSALRSVTGGRIITVFGCGGDRDREKRPRMGRVAEAGSDHIVVTSDNPRTEPPEAILDEIRAGLRNPEDAVFEPDRRAAIGLGIRMARQADTVLIAGKGHETYQEINHERTPFDDREVAREFIREQEALRLSWNRSN
jgi:UDP-N-acetylmuramoyl-L-alanyl-D-glutamate--2,6-diaminopimelate ligase